MARLLLLLTTIGSVLLLSWTLSLWSEDDRLCVSDLTVAAFQFIKPDGTKVSIPECSPISYLFQPELEKSEMAVAQKALVEVSKAKMISKRLGIPLRNRFHIELGEKDSPLFSSRLMSFVVSEANGFDLEGFSVAGAFYGLYIQDQYFRNNKGWLEKRYKEALLDNDLSRQNAVLLMLHFKRLKATDRLPMLKTLWMNEFPLKGVDSEWLSAERQRLGHMNAVIQINTEDQFMSDYFLVQASDRLVEQKKSIVVETKSVHALYPQNFEYVGSQSNYTADHLIVLQCDPPEADVRSSLGYKDVYFVEYCAGADAEKVSEVASQVLDYVKSMDKRRFKLRPRKVSLHREN